MAAKGQVSSVLVGEGAKLDIGAGVCYDLEEVGARFWEWVEELRLVEEIQAVMLEEYEVYLVSGRHILLVVDTTYSGCSRNFRARGS